MNNMKECYALFYLFFVIAFYASLSFVPLSGPSIGISPVPSFAPASGWGDFNRDGYLDLAFCGINGGVYLNNGNETFTLLPSSGAIMASSRTCFVAVGDVNNDNWPDIVFNGAGMRLLLNYQNNTFSNIAVTGAPNGIQKLYDMNNDGRQDILTGYGPSPGS